MRENPEKNNMTIETQFVSIVSVSPCTRYRRCHPVKNLLFSWIATEL